MFTRQTLKLLEILEKQALVWMLRVFFVKMRPIIVAHPSFIPEYYYPCNIRSVPLKLTLDNVIKILNLFIDIIILCHGCVIVADKMGTSSNLD